MKLTRPGHVFFSALAHELQIPPSRLHAYRRAGQITTFMRGPRHLVTEEEACRFRRAYQESQTPDDADGGRQATAPTDETPSVPPVPVAPAPASTTGDVIATRWREYDQLRVLLHEKTSTAAQLVGQTFPPDLHQINLTCIPPLPLGKFSRVRRALEAQRLAYDRLELYFSDIDEQRIRDFESRQPR